MELEQAVEYESPEIVDYGDLVELTAGQANGHGLDSAFHTGTPVDHHPSFSNH
ncbi:MAG: lasso RiPP family leader peptide-containing protein [Gaiellaceae bacterium MAG52_C11]|nr:lasso RiPP family leader peptide-containing protein [Candidatus Gaiellasilicea maunaloa]